MKLNKSAVIRAAQSLAASNTEVNGMSLDQIKAMDWDTRQKKARELSLNVALNFDSAYNVAGQQAFVDEVMGIWGRRLKEHEAARLRFKRATTGLTVAQAEQKVAELIQSMNIRGMKSEGSYGSFAVERSWGAGATLYVRFDHDYDNRIVNPDNDRQSAGVYHVRVEITWSSTGRTLSECELALKVYRELLDAAHEVQVVMARENVIWTHGLDQPKELTPVPEAKIEGYND